MIYREVLQNGIRVVIEEIPSVRSVSLGIWVGAGSRDESPQNNGVTHFIEHMMFKGTEKLNARQIAELFDGIGGQVNAFTSKEYTCYYAKVLDEHFGLALETLGDMVLNSKFAEEELAKERRVVLEEIKMYEDAPDDLVHDMIAEVVFQKHPLGYNILGTEANLNAFVPQDLFSYMEEKYTTDNVVIAIAGNVKRDHAVALASKLFGHLQPSRISRQEEQAVFHAGKAIRNKKTEQAHIVLGAPGIAYDDPMIYPVILFNNVLGGSSSSRLFQEIREERGLAYSIYSYHTAYKDIGMFGLYVGTAPERAQHVLDLCEQVLGGIAQHGITADELNKAKEQVKGSLMLSLESTSSRMSRLGKNELLGRHISLDEMVDKIKNVTLEDVKTAAGAILGGKFAMSAVGPLDDLRAPGETK
ncbi:putative Zn-dependent peptidase [Tumebacillus sp. BK434]|uniref:M16 family metallopeptidase n=1 Tax=Tumebacillus sp. BK434 TaxID=2512169 RepID=UPI0010EC99F9|nr:pitrilysin family protein [Tumebacillus sp. BK434]TCP58881.1 putative Zn-dependent peptidase [Tumebacillus sp. BK434]